MLIFHVKIFFAEEIKDFLQALYALDSLLRLVKIQIDDRDDGHKGDVRSYTNFSLQLAEMQFG